MSGLSENLNNWKKTIVVGLGVGVGTGFGLAKLGASNEQKVADQQIAALSQQTLELKDVIIKREEDLTKKQEGVAQAENFITDFDQKINGAKETLGNLTTKRDQLSQLVNDQTKELESLSEEGKELNKTLKSLNKTNKKLKKEADEILAKIEPKKRPHPRPFPIPGNGPLFFAEGAVGQSALRGPANTKNLTQDIAALTDELVDLRVRFQTLIKDAKATSEKDVAVQKSLDERKATLGKLEGEITVMQDNVKQLSDNAAALYTNILKEALSVAQTQAAIAGAEGEGSLYREQIKLGNRILAEQERREEERREQRRDELDRLRDRMRRPFRF